MANELPEVVPLVQSMPTTGWILQTQGSARRRITDNKSKRRSGNFDTEGIYDVAGVPGHSHNASAVVAVDADYTRYRTVALSIDHLIWAYNVLNLPIGALHWLQITVRGRTIQVMNIDGMVLHCTVPDKDPPPEGQFGIFSRGAKCIARTLTISSPAPVENIPKKKTDAPAEK